MNKYWQTDNVEMSSESIDWGLGAKRGHGTQAGWWAGGSLRRSLDNKRDLFRRGERMGEGNSLQG